MKYHVNCTIIRGLHFTMLQKGVWKSDNVKKSIKAWVQHTENMVASDTLFQQCSKLNTKGMNTKEKTSNRIFCEKCGIDSEDESEKDNWFLFFNIVFC